MLGLFVASVSCKLLYLNLTAAGPSPCDSKEGCNIVNMNKSLSISDQIQLMDSKIQGDDAKQILDLINESSSKNITVVGAPTEISNPSVPVSEYPAIYLENSSITLKSITFQYFKTPLINSQSSSIQLDAISIEHTDSSVACLLAFIDTTISASNFNLLANSATNQVLLAGLKVKLSISGFSFVQNSLISESPQASLHFVESEVSINSAAFRHNTMKLPLLAVSNHSVLSLSHCNFDQNDVLSFIFSEESTKVTMSFCNFTSNSGRITDAKSEVTLAFLDSSISKHSGASLLFDLSDSYLRLENGRIENSTIAGIAANEAQNGEHSIAIRSFLVDYIETSIPIFASIGGSVSINGLKVKGITSESEILVLSHSNGIGTSVTDSKFTKMSAKNKVSTSITVINSSTVTFERVKWTKNDACGALFDSTPVSIHSSIFENNQCSPTGNTIPLAIISGSKTDSFSVSDSKFTNNTALTGSVFIINSTATISSSEFEGNKAIQGAAIFAADMNLRIMKSEFRDNSAMTVGGAVSLSDGITEIENCKFEGNQAPEGSAISIKMGKTTMIRRVYGKGNLGNNGTFVHASGDKLTLTIEDSEIDDDQSAAIFVDPKKAIHYHGAKFECKKKCRSARGDSLNFPWAWVAAPLIFALGIIGYRKVGSRGLSAALPKALRGKGHHNL